MGKKEDKINDFIQPLIARLVAGEYAQIEKITRGRRLPAQTMKRVVDGYGRTLIMPPLDAHDRIDVVEVKNACPAKWSVVMPLWTLEEGRSDLTLELTLTDRGGSFDVELDDLHVL
jgi:hypothetical protein